LVIASSASVASTDLYTPSLPHLPEYFSTTPELVKLTLSLNVLAFGIAQLFNGPLSDRVGRRPVFIVGMTAFTLLALACALAQSITQLIAARVLLGIAASVEAVVGYAVIHDIFEEQDRIRAMAIFGIMFAVTPAVAPIIGGYVHVSFGWRMNFVLVFIIGVITTLLIWRKLPESTTPDPTAFKPRALLQDYWRLLSNSRFVAYSLVCGAALGSIFAFVTAGPFVLIEQHQVQTQHFGYYQGVMIIAYVLGAQSANKLAGRISPHSIIAFGLVFAMIGAVLLPIIIMLGMESAVTVIAAISVLSFGLGPLFAAAPALALGQAGGRAGVAAALLGALEMSVGGIAATAVSVFHDGTTRPLAYTSLVMALMAVAAFAYVHKLGKRQDREQAA